MGSVPARRRLVQPVCCCVSQQANSAQGHDTGAREMQPMRCVQSHSFSMATSDMAPARGATERQCLVRLLTTKSYRRHLAAHANTERMAG